MNYNKTFYNESHLRSILKGLSWRILGSTTILIITYFTTKQIGTAIKITSIEFIIKIFIYYLHERLWLLIKIK